MDIMDVLRTLAEKGDLNIVAEEGVRGRITLFLNDVEIADALDIIAEMNDIAYIKEKNSIKMMTSKRYEELYGRPFGEKTSLKVFDLVNADAAVVANQLSQLKTKSGKIMPDPRTNVIMVIDTPVALEEMGSVVRTMDLPVSTRSYSLKYVSADAVVPAVKSILTPAGKVEVSKENNTLVLTDIEENLDQAAILLGEFDSHQALVTKAFSFKYASQKAVLPIITAEITQGVGSVYADEKNNQLVVTDMPERVARIEELAEMFDKKTPQVLIEAKILQINLNDNTKLGVQWEAIQDRIKKFEEVGPVDVRLDYRILAAGEQGTRVFAGGLDERDYEAVVEMLETTTEANLLSSPRITALNNETAEILVGSTVPYKTIDTREENGTIRTFEKVTTVDVGVKLSVTPTINDDGFIAMKIKPEVSSIVAYSEGIPVVEKTQTETSVLVKDGVTIIIAGLVREERTQTAKGVPFLKDIPILGILFRSTDDKRVKSEIAIFITPHIITGDVSTEVPKP
ncbi:MAG: secretin N-terminal domain-containing protein [Candidatus Eisenbacteria bacterium]